MRKFLQANRLTAKILQSKDLTTSNTARPSFQRIAYWSGSLNYDRQGTSILAFPLIWTARMSTAYPPPLPLLKTNDLSHD
jgi:hypothetical protein